MSRPFKIVFICILLVGAAAAQNKESWNWDVETIAPEGKFTSVTTDSDRNIYVSFTAPDGIKFAYRPAGVHQKWFVMYVGNDVGFTSITLDQNSKPYICFNGHGSLFVAHLMKNDFVVQPIAPQTGTLSYSCSIVVARDGSPAVTWYHEKTPDGLNYVHFKYAELRDGAWRARTPDFDMQAGKWHSMKIDPAGHVLVAYDSFIAGQMKLATYDGSKWDMQIVDKRTGGARSDYSIGGMGNSFALDAKGKPHISYYTNSELRYAEQNEVGRWKVEKVDDVSPSGAWLGYRSSTVIDSKGNPHVFYQDMGALKHAYREDGTWRFQLMVGAGEGDPYQYQSATVDAAGRIILVFRDTSGGALKAAIGTLGLEGGGTHPQALPTSKAGNDSGSSTPTAKQTKGSASVKEDAAKNPGPEKN